ncbi:MAG: hypothetical protein ACREMF_01930 [Gemmatimonadales bacterium]
MRRSMLVVCALVAGTTLGCDKIKEAIEKRKNRNRPPPTQTAPTPDTTKAVPAPAPETTAATPPPAPARTPTPQIEARPIRDEPYNSPDTGTVAPGMGEEDVIALWGPPAARRLAGPYMYLHYPNGCEYTCGTTDIVIFQDGQVVDAVVRWPGHGYSGQSSSPPGRVPEATIQ